MPHCINATAVHELLVDTDPEVCVEHLEEMWESWITNERNDFCAANVRADMLVTYKTIKRLLCKIKR